jgi:hypothetical protein
MLDAALDQRVPSKMVVETRFTDFMEGCLAYADDGHFLSGEGKVKLSVWYYNGKQALPEDGSQHPNQQSMNPATYRQCRFRNIEMNFYARAIIKHHKYRKLFIHGDDMPDIPSPCWCFEQWNRAEILPITKSLNMHYESFYQNKGVREMSVLSSNVQSVTRKEKQRVSGYRTKIAHHSLHYCHTWECINDAVNQKQTHTLVHLKGHSAATTDENGVLFHATDVTVHESPDEAKAILTKVVEKTVGPVPSRKDQILVH